MGIFRSMADWEKMEMRMTTLDKRESVIGRREPSDSRLPLIVQRKQREDAAQQIASDASRAFTRTLKREIAKIDRSATK